MAIPGLTYNLSGHTKSCSIELSMRIKIQLQRRKELACSRNDYKATNKTIIIWPVKFDQVKRKKYILCMTEGVAKKIKIPILL